MAETDAGLHVQTTLVGSPVVLGLVHAVEQVAIDRTLTAGVEDPYDSTHTGPWGYGLVPETES